MRRFLTFSLVLGLLVGMFVATDIVPGPRHGDSPPQAAEPTAAPPLRVALVGDSLSAGRSRFLGNGLDEESWMTYAEGDGIEFAGGWARSGATPDEMARAVRPVDNVDVLVVLAGTNAVRTAETMAEEAPAYEQIVSVIKPRRVVIASIPPYRRHPAEAIRYNEDLRQFTDSHGWSWADPWVPARDGDQWLSGFSVDGTHPAGPKQYAVLGKSMRRIILETRVLPAALG